MTKTTFDIPHKTIKIEEKVKHNTYEDRWKRTTAASPLVRKISKPSTTKKVATVEECYNNHSSTSSTIDLFGK